MKKLVLAVVLLYLPFGAGAWNLIGHRVVGEVADQYINAKTRKAIQQILGSESIGMSANWADFVKSDTTYNYLGNWHYFNIPANLSKTDMLKYVDGQSGPNVYKKITEMIAVLKNSKSTLIQKKLALKMLIHMVGDLHQPMHTARPEDQGGNKVLLTWFGEKSNLHKVWDEGLVDFQKLSYTEYAKAINHPTTAEFTTWQKTSLRECVLESYQICNQIYAGTKMDDKLSYKYNFDWIATVNQQLLKGGIRLAKILNDIYTPKA